MMKLSILLFLILSPLVVAQEAGPVILSISGSPSSTVAPVYTSRRGGALVYIQAVGHDPMASGNLVYVGNFPCIIPSDGVTDTYITCETTDSGLNQDISNLPVTLISYSIAFTTVSPNLVNYVASYTPQLTELFPASGFANLNINFYGVHRITNLGDGRDMGDVVKLKLGNDLCSRFDVVQSAISSTSANAYIRCIESSLQVAGKYNVTEHVTPGIANHASTLRRASLVEGEYFEFTALPTVSSVSPASGNLGGQIITVSGTGFSGVLANNSVSVDGNNCVVNTVSEQQLTCTLDARDPSKSALLTTTSASQSNGYFAGAGLKYARYGITGSPSLSTFVSAVRSSNSAFLGTPQETGYRAELKEGDTYGSYYGQTWKGYFTAPVSGSYTFRGLADDAFSLYISSVAGSTEISNTPLISSASVQSDWTDFYYDDVAGSEASVTLTAGSSYYIEAYHLNFVGTGYFRIEADVPNSNTNLPFQAYEVDKIVIGSTIQPEVVNYTLTGGSTGSINLKIARVNTAGKITYNVNKTIVYGCSDTDFKNALNSFDTFSSFRISVTRFIYDGSGNEINTTVGASSIVYQVSFLLLRTAAQSAEDFTYTYLNYTGTMTKAAVTSHSPILSGTYSLTIGGITFDNLSYAISANALQAKINTIVGYEQVFVDQVTVLGTGYDNTWIINYVGVNSAVPNATVNGALLSGGSTSPTIQLTVRRQYSPAITFSPVDYRFLSTYESQPTVLVNVNSIPAVCRGDCRYTFIDGTKITALSLSGGDLTMTITSQLNTTIPVSTITVQVQGLPCTVSNASTLASLTCSLSKNSDNSPTLVAGTFFPAVYINPSGYTAIASGVNAIPVSLVTSGLSVSSGGNNGGYYNVLTGSGFPLDKSKITITVCGNTATIINSNNIQVSFYTPACASTGVQNVNVAVGSATSSSLTFTYTDGSSSAPIISAISPTSQNPAIKGILTINGSGFGNVTADIQVFLSNSSGKVYQLRVIQAHDTYITVGLSGGLPGVFTVQVTLPNSVGDSIASPGVDQFQYLCSITSISPTSGSYYGGTLITITGNNFSPAYSDTLVYVGDTLNWFCNIQTITATQITCRTPAFDVKHYNISEEQKVVISTKLYSLNTCPGNNCGFTYNPAASSPTLTKISASSAGSINITLNGTSLLNGACGVSLTSQANSSLVFATTATCTNTSAVFKVPATVPSGNYFVKVRNDIGESNGLALKVNWVAGIPSYNGGGSVMGNIVTFSMGSGYPSVLGSGFNILVDIGGNNAAVNVISCCTNNVLTLALPPSPPTKTITITFKGPVGSYSTTYTTSNAMTPSIIAPNTTFTPGANTVTFTRNDTTGLPITSLKLVSAVDATNIVTISNFTNSSTTSYSFTTTLSSGSYNILALTDYGYCKVSNPINVGLPASVTAASIISSFAGGVFTITGNNLSPSSYITVNGFKGTVNTYTSTAVTFNVPPFITSNSQNAFNLAKVAQIDSSTFVYSSDKAANMTNVTAAFDNDISTVYGSSNAVCYIEIDVGQGLQASVSRFRFFPYYGWDNTANSILGGVFEGSNDDSTWQLLGTLDQTVHSGWNVLVSKDTTPYRYFRFRHTSDSQCNLAEIQLFGIPMSSSTATLSSTRSAVTYNDGANTRTFSNAIQFRSDQTPIVQSVVPPYGDIFGGYTITISGSNLGFAPATILIDGVACAVANSTNNSIACTVGARPSIPATNTFKVSIGGSNAVIINNFLYVLKWSDSRTWGVDLPPIADDLVYVPPGMTLLIDQDTPVLKGIAVEKGTLIFPNDTDVTVSTGFITMNGGTFLAGTESAPLYSKLTFVMYGGYYGKQQVMFGNKGIGCLNCKFSMYGRPRKPTWTTISATINPGDTSFTVNQDIDWAAGETIVVAATGFYHFEAEQRNIVSVSGRTVTVDAPFTYKHVSVEETYGTSDKLVMRAEVGLLTRNIKMMGDPTSVVAKYGSHLMLSGTYPDGLQGHVAYSEFTHCGQPQILGRYCMHFHMAAEVPTSFVRGNAVHESFARVVTIHGVYLLTVQNNVGYRVRGHNFFVEDGIETHNTIRNNLAISSLAVTNMLQTDTSVASFWVTNPTNDFYGNHAAGGDFYGIWYEIKSNPDGPSATNDVCPIGNPLGYVANNVAHSNTRFGLRIFKLYSRKNPCNPVRKDSNASDPWFSNPSSPSVFHNFTIYKNLEDGVLAEQTGNVMFNNFTIAENYRSGVEFYMANFTKEMVSVNNCAIIGQSVNNVEADTSNYTNGMAAVITPRTGQTNITNTRFYNYPVGSTAIITCSMCDDIDLFTNLGTEVFIKNLTFDSFSGNYLFMINMKRDIIYSLDDSIAVPFDGNSIARTSATIVSNYNHIANYHQAHCVSSSEPSKWDNAIICDQTITIRRIYITNPLDKYTFSGQNMKVKRLASLDEVVDPAVSSSLYTSITTRFNKMEPMKEKPLAWSLPYVAGQIYQVWWGTGMDFSHISIASTTLYTPSDAGVIFKFNYTLNRELFNVGPMLGGSLLTSANYISENANYSTLNTATCTNGEYFHNNENSTARHLGICQSGKNKQTFEYTEVNAVICMFHCPAPAGTFVKEPFTRRWSNASQWPNGTVPAAMDNVTVNGNWTVLLDIDPAPANYLIIDGTLVADDTRDVNITARSIFIRAGNVTAGSPSAPFMHKFTIQVSNTKEDHGWYIDPLVAGNKYIIVTGSLNLYGVSPATVRTSLTQPAFAGDSIIYVAASADWQVGDKIALSPSYGIYSEYESVTITAVNANGSVSVSPALQYNHYGSSGPITTPNGNIDVNTHVGHLNRNVQIVPGPDYGWGVNLLVYGFMDGDIHRVGSVNLDSVSIVDGGQYDTTASALQFLNIISPNYTSTVTATSFINCKAWCVNINNVQNVTFTNNVFYNGWVFGVQAKTISNFQFTDNLFIGIVERPTMAFGNELIACFATYDYVNPATDNVAVQNNFCLGSQGHGFAFPHIKCSELETNPFKGNTAGSCQVGFIFNNIPTSDECKAFSYINAYASQIGQICGPISTTSMVYKNFVMVDNKRGATLKFGHGEGTSNHTGIFTDSYISAVSRPNCAYCYGNNAIPCASSIGMRLLTVSANGETLPNKFGPGYDVICKQELYESKVYMTNVTFDSFNQTYLGSVASQCRNNFIFRGHSVAFDSVADTNLFNVTVRNSDKSSYLYADENSPSQIGWFGGCGDILCTGRSNFVIVDWTGDFLGFTGTIVPNNTVFGSNQSGCVFNSPMNSHICTRTDIATLAYQSVAPDFNTRIMWPVSLTYDGGNYTTLTNGWREWDWLGKEPQNHRFGRFLSLVKLNSTYNFTFTAMPPVKMQYQIQKRKPLGISENYIVVKIHYPMPNMIQVKVRGTVMDPVLITDSGIKRPLNKSLCGDNVYFYTNYTSHFVVTEDFNCLVDIALTDTIQLTTHFAMNASDFFTNTAQSSFISNLCALLGITDTSRVKIVGVVTGSTIVTTSITDTGSTNGTNATGGSTLPQITAILAANSTAVGASLGTALGTTTLAIVSAYYPVYSTSSDSSSSSNLGLIVGVAVAGVVLIFVMVFVFFYCLRKRAKIVEEIRQSEEEFHHDKEIEKDHNFILGHESMNIDPNGSHSSEFKINQNSGKVALQREQLDE